MFRSKKCWMVYVLLATGSLIGERILLACQLLFSWMRNHSTRGLSSFTGFIPGPRMWQLGNNPIKFLFSCRERLEGFSFCFISRISRILILYCVPLGAQSARDSHCSCSAHRQLVRSQWKICISPRMCSSGYSSLVCTIMIDLII